MSQPRQKHPIFEHPTLLTMRRLQQRGWTPELVSELLGDPDERPANPLRPGGAPLKLYALSRIETAEESQRFKEVQLALRAAGIRPNQSPQGVHQNPHAPINSPNSQSRHTTSFGSYIQPSLPPGTLLTIRLKSLSTGSMQLRGEIEVTYMPGAEGGKQLRASGQEGWLTTPGGARNGQLLGRAVSIHAQLEEAP